MGGTAIAFDFDGDALTFTVATQPVHGGVTMSADGTFTYTPAADYHGDDSFTFVATDGSATTEPTAVTVTIDRVNDAPVAQHGIAATNANQAVAGILIAADADGDALSFEITGLPVLGRVSLAGGAFVFTRTRARAGQTALRSSRATTTQPATSRPSRSRSRP